MDEQKTEQKMSSGLKMTFLFEENKVYVSDGIFQALGDPEFVRLFVQPGQKLLFFDGVTREERRKFKVPCERAKYWKPYLKSDKALVAHLYRSVGWKEGTDICVHGKIFLTSMGAKKIVFDAKEAEEIQV